MQRPRHRHLLAILAAATAMTGSCVSFGQNKEPPPTERAQALFDKAWEEMDKGQYEPACKELEEVTRLVPEKVGALAKLAECYEKLGRLASAWNAYSAAATKAREQGQVQRANQLTQQVALLQPRLSTLTIYVPEAIQDMPGLSIMRDAELITRATWGTAIPVDGGEHQIVTAATGHQPFRQAVIVPGEHGQQSVTVGLSAPENSRPPFPRMDNSATAARSGSVVPLLPSTRESSSWGLSVGLFTIGIGAIGVGVGIGFGADAMAKNMESNAAGHCNEANQCDRTGNVLRSAAVSSGTFATWTLIPGGVVAAAGAALVIWGPRGASTASGKISPRVVVTGTAISVQGGW